MNHGLTCPGQIMTLLLRTPYQIQFTWAEGADGTVDGALVMNGKFGLGTKKADGTMNDIPVGNEAYSVSFWFKGDVQVEGAGLNRLG